MDIRSRLLWYVGSFRGPRQLVQDKIGGAGRDRAVCGPSLWPLAVGVARDEAGFDIEIGGSPGLKGRVVWRVLTEAASCWWGTHRIIDIP